MSTHWQRLREWCVDHPDTAALILFVCRSLGLSALALLLPFDSSVAFVLGMFGIGGLWATWNRWEGEHQDRRITGRRRD